MKTLAFAGMSLAMLTGCGRFEPIGVQPVPPSAGSSAAETVIAPSAPPRENIVRLTDRSADKLRELQQSANGANLRVAVKQGGSTGFMYDLDFDDKVDAATDEVEESKGVKIVVDRRSSIFLQGTTIDFITNEAGQSGFRFDNPNAVEP